MFQYGFTVIIGRQRIENWKYHLKMKVRKLNILVISIWVFVLILFPLSAKAEMREITDDQMEQQYLKKGDLRPLPELVAQKDIEDIKDEDKELLEETEEDRLEAYIRENSLPELNDGLVLEDYWEYYDTYLDREDTQIQNWEGEVIVNPVGNPVQGP